MAETSQGMSDEQVEELLTALLDFRQMLLGLTDRFQSRLALLEQEFAERRTAPLQLSKEAPQQRLKTGNLRGQTGALGEVPDSPLAAASEPEADIFDDQEAFEPDETDAFSIVDFDDEDDF